MRWDVNEGRYTTLLPGGLVAHAARTPIGWEVLVPMAGIHEIVRNPALVTWISARPIVERVIRARMEGVDP